MAFSFLNWENRVRHYRAMIALLVVVCVNPFVANTARAEDGYRLWMRYDQLPDNATRYYRDRVTNVIGSTKSSTLDAARKELMIGVSGLLNRPLPSPASNAEPTDGSVIAGTPESSPLIARMNLAPELASLGPDGFLIRSMRVDGRMATVIASKNEGLSGSAKENLGPFGARSRGVALPT